jgi:hypothetical protein
MMSSPPSAASAARESHAGESTRLAAWRALGRGLDSKDPRQTREAAAMLTSEMFFAPMLAEMRKLPFGKEFGHGGRTEEAFGEQLDMRLADSIARADGSLTAQIADRLARGSRAVTADKLESERALWRLQTQLRTRDGDTQR